MGPREGGSRARRPGPAAVLSEAVATAPFSAYGGWGGKKTRGGGGSGGLVIPPRRGEETGNRLWALYGSSLWGSAVVLFR